MAYYSQSQLKGLMATSDPNNRKNILKAMIARGDQLEGFNAPVAAKPATVAPVSTPAAPAKEAGWGAKLSNLGAQAVGGLSKGVGRTLSLAGTAADYVTPDVGTLGKASTFLGKGLNIVTPKALEKYNPLTAIGSGLQAADTKMSDYAESKLGTRSLNPVSLLGAGAQKLGQTAQDVSTQLSGVSKDALSSKIGRGLGEGTAMFLGGGAGAKAGQALGNAASKFVPSALSKYAPSLAPKLGTFAANSPRLASIASKVPGFLGSSVGFTEGASVAGQGRLANKKELGTGLAFDVGTAGLGRLAKFGADKLYGSVLRPTAKVEKDLFKNYGVKMGDLVRKYKLMGGPQKSLDKIEPMLKTTWKGIQKQAANIKPLTKESYDEIEAELIKKLLGNVDTAGKQKTAQVIAEAVADIKPVSGVRSGAEVLDDIKQLNQTLYNYGERGVLSPKQLKSLDSALKIQLKSFLPESARKGYAKYAELSTLKGILKDETVRHAVGRATVGAGSGAVVGSTSALATGGDWKKALIGGIAGGAMGAGLMRLTSSPNLISRAGQALDATGKVVAGGLPKLAQRAATSGVTTDSLKSQPTDMTPDQVPETSAFKSIINESVQPVTDAPEFSSQFPPAIANSPLLSKIASGDVTLTKAQKEELLSVMPEASALIDQAEELAKKAPGKGKAIPAKIAETVAKSRSMERQFRDLATVLAKVEGKMGPLGKGKLASWNPYDADVRELTSMIQSLTGPTAKTVMMEVGALTDSDLARVEEVLPQITDTPEAAAVKLANLLNNVKMNRSDLMDEFEAQGYNVEAIKNNQRVKLPEGKGKALPSTAIQEMAKAKSLNRQMQDFKGTLNNLSSKLGPSAGRISSLNPYDVDVQTLKAVINSLTGPTARGVMQEVGALTASDLARVETVLPQMSDTPEVATRKINNLIKNLEENQQNKILTYSQAGYNIGGSGSETNIEDQQYGITP